MIEITMEVEGLEPLMRRMNDPHIQQFGHKRMTEAVSSLSIAVKSLPTAGQGFIPPAMPHDTGDLRSSIDFGVKSLTGGIEGQVGTPKKHGPWMEFGTGLMSDGPQGSSSRHWPPSTALEVWAGRHGFPSAFLVARAIGRRGGLKPRRFLRGTFERERSKVLATLGKVASDVAKYLAGKG